MNDDFVDRVKINGGYVYLDRLSPGNMLILTLVNLNIIQKLNYREVYELAELLWSKN